VAFIRRVRTGSGATAVQIAEYTGGRQRIVEHVGSAHTEAELGVLLARARELLEDPAQGTLNLAVEPSVPVASIVAAPADAALFDPSPAAAGGRAGPGKVVGTHSRLLFDALAEVYAALGFDVLGDAVFRDLVIARVVEPTSLLDVARVLTDLGRAPASYPAGGLTTGQPPTGTARAGSGRSGRGGGAWGGHSVCGDLDSHARLRRELPDAVGGGQLVRAGHEDDRDRAAVVQRALD